MRHWGGYGNPWYLGVPLLVLLILFVVTERGRRSTWLLAAGVLVTGVVVPALWMKRNVDVGSGLLGSRQDAAASPLT
jgi:hypothetical protein